MSPTKVPPDIKALAKELRAGSRAALARAITLIESRRADHQASARDLVQVLLPDTGMTVYADAGRTSQIMANLIGNAVKYSPRGGQVLVR